LSLHPHSFDARIVLAIRQIIESSLQSLEVFIRTQITVLNFYVVQSLVGFVLLIQTGGTVFIGNVQIELLGLPFVKALAQTLLVLLIHKA